MVESLFTIEPVVYKNVIKKPAVVAELVNALYSLAFYPYSKVEGSNPGGSYYFSRF